MKVSFIYYYVLATKSERDRLRNSNHDIHDRTLIHLILIYIVEILVLESFPQFHHPNRNFLQLMTGLRR